jgi:hypothetical protein
MRSLICLAGLLLLSPKILAGPPGLDSLAADLSGTFSSADQARGDEHFRDLTLHVVPVWTDRRDGPWLYCEQSLTDAPDHPYRQRLYQLAARADGAFEIRIFDLPDAVPLTGAWKNPTLLAGLNPASLTPQPGCILVLRCQPDGSFKGGTEGKACANTLHGATYATTEITVSEQQTVTYERGYNAGDTQVWGSNRGGYIFNKI